MSEGFLTRWSRRKGEACRARQDPAPPPDRAAGLAPGAPPEAPAVETGLTPEELAALPKLDELTSESDITGFLRRGVPEALRNAALRKTWMLDPGIRDFVGHARDYAYDWNTPGGVPGNSPIQPHEAMALVRRVFGEADAAPSGKGTNDCVAPARPVEDGPAAAKGDAKTEIPVGEGRTVPDPEG